MIVREGAEANGNQKNSDPNPRRALRRIGSLNGLFNMEDIPLTQQTALER